MAELRSPTYVAAIISCNLNVLACLEHVFSANIFTIKRTLMISAGFLTLSSLPFVLALAFALCLLSLCSVSLSRSLCHSSDFTTSREMHGRSISAEPMLETSFLSRGTPIQMRSCGSAIPDCWTHGKLRPINQKIKRRGPPGLRQSAPDLLSVFRPLPPMVKPQTPVFRGWCQQYQPGAPGVNYDMLPIRPL